MSSKNFYWGESRILVSDAPTESSASAYKMSKVRAMMTMASNENFLDLQKKRLIDDMPHPLKQPIDLLGLKYVGEQSLSALAEGMLLALRRLQAKQITMSGKNKETGKTYSTEKDVNGSMFNDVYDFLVQMEALEKTFNAAAKRGTIDAAAWGRMRSRFFLKRPKGPKNAPAQILFAAMDRILNGTSTTGDLAKVFNAIRGDFGNALGTAMEGIIVNMLNTTTVQRELANQIGTAFADSFKMSAKATGANTAVAGTIRATIDGVHFKPSPEEVTGTITGKNLRDGVLTVVSNKNGGAIQLGISAKQYNFYSSRNAGSIRLAELSMSNFVDVFANIKLNTSDQGTNRRGANAMYGYRLLGESKDMQSAVLQYILAHRVGEVAFGSSIGQKTGRDTAELMVINGKLMNTADVLNKGNLTVRAEGLPPGNNGDWIAGKYAALNYASKIHKSKLIAELSFGKQNAINMFG